MDEQQKQEFRHALYEQFARIGKALGNARRLEIFDLLSQAEQSVETLAQKTGMSVASVSQNLQILRSARLVIVRREGTYAYYRLADEHVLRVWTAMSELGMSHLLEIDNLMKSYTGQRGKLEAINADDLIRRLKDGSLVLLDARPQDEYEAGHIPGALSLPVSSLEVDLLALSKEQEIVAYCRNSYCLLSNELAEVLQGKGYKVRVLDGGITNWQLQNRPIERDSNSSSVS